MLAVGLALGLTVGLATLGATAGAAEAAPSGTTTSGTTGSTVTGTLVRAYAESPDATTDHRLLTWVEGAGTTVRVPSTDSDIADVPTGSRVAVRLGATITDATSRDGVQRAHDVLRTDVLSRGTSTTPSTSTTASTSTARTAAGTTSVPATSTAAAGTAPTGATVHDVTVVMAVPAGGTQDATTLSQVVSEINGPVQGYWNDSSGGRITLNVSHTVDWTQLTTGCSNPTALWNEAAADAGWTPGPDKHLVVYLSSTPADLSGCADGLAEVGSGLDAGGRLYIRSTDPDVLAHEFGHNLGLMHAAEEQCDSLIEGTSSQCRETTYRDLYDVMAASWGPLGALSGFQATQLGFMPAAQRREVSASSGAGRVTLSPVGASGGVRAVRLRTSDGTTYWVEYRAPVGRDAYLTTSANWVKLSAGVVVRREGNTSAGEDATELLDATPSARANWDSDVNVVAPVGSTISLDHATWYLTVTSQSATSAVVDLRPTASPSPSIALTRQFGTTRYGTAAALAAAAYPRGASTVVVASGAAFPDALAAGPAAAASTAPLLLVPASGPLPDVVTSELRALAPQSITVVGGTTAVGDDVLRQLNALAPTTRIAGDTRYATAAKVATSGNHPTGGTVYLASGTSFPDGLAGGAAAAHSGASLLLTSGTTLEPATAAAITALAPRHVVALGGDDRISAAVLQAAAAASPGADTDRWFGDDRYATAQAIAAHADGASAPVVVLASGESFPDALAAAPVAGLAGQPLLLTMAACAPSVTVQAVTGYGATAATVVGGTTSVSDNSAALTPCP